MLMESDSQVILNDRFTGAVADGQQEEAIFTLQIGADPFNSETMSEMTKANMFRLINAIAEKGYDINTPDEFGQTLLHWACATQDDSYEMIKLLLKLGADVNAKKSTGETPLDFFVAYGNEQDIEAYKRVIKLLVSAGADPSSSFSSFSDFKDLFSGDLSWIPGGEGTLERKFRSIQIRKNLF